jgi:carbamate kinase
MPMDVSVAYSQGFIGYIIEQQLRNVLKANDLERDIITIITQVLVDKEDSAFTNPTKPVGPYYTKEEADKIGC